MSPTVRDGRILSPEASRPATLIDLSARRPPTHEWVSVRVDLFPNGASGRRAFAPKRLADEALRLLSVGRLAGDLRVYRDGAYRAGEEPLHEFALDALGDDFTPARHRDFLSTLLLMAPALPDVPDPRLVVFRNCTVDWTTGEQHAHSPEHRMTVALPVDYEPDATCPAIDEFLADVIAEAFLTRAYEIAGYCMTSWNALRAFAWLVGLPAQGKSTFAEGPLVSLLGPENVVAVQPHRLADSAFAGASLVGKLANIAPDVSARDLGSVAFLKSTTGDDLVSVERKFHEATTARVFSKFVFTSNTLPTFSDVSGAVSSRVKVVEFERQTKRDDDPHLRARLTTPEELSGFANRALFALYELRSRGGFTENLRTQKALASFRTATNTVAAFLEEGCVCAPDARTRRSDLWQAFKAWADDGRKGQKTGRNTFFETLRAEHGLTTVKTSGETYIVGVRLDEGFAGRAKEVAS